MDVKVGKHYDLTNLTFDELMLIKALLSLNKSDMKKLTFSESSYNLSAKLFLKIDKIVQCNGDKNIT
jgi:hypothetical protein